MNTGQFQRGQNVGPNNARWAGDEVSIQGGRLRARRMYPGQHVCERDGCTRKAERHHKDGDTKNNAPENIAFLCNKHHKEADGRMTRREFREAHRRAVKGVPLTGDHKSKISAGLKGHPVSVETRTRLAAAQVARAAANKPSHCPQGHAYDAGNTYQAADGRRSCKACARDRAKQRYLAKKSEGV